MAFSENLPVSKGDRVLLSRHCPFDFEGAGPLPGATGRVMAVPRNADPQHAVAVRFDGYPSMWRIPGEYLEILSKPS